VRVRGVRSNIFRRLDDRAGDPIKRVHQKWEDAGYGDIPREGRRRGATELQPAVVKSKNGYDVPVLKVNNATHDGVPKAMDSSKWGALREAGILKDKNERKPKGETD